MVAVIRIRHRELSCERPQLRLFKMSFAGDPRGFEQAWAEETGGWVSPPVEPRTWASI